LRTRDQFERWFEFSNGGSKRGAALAIKAGGAASATLQ